MDHDIYGGQRQVWNMLRNCRKPVNDYVQICNITKESWENYFENLYHKSNTNVQVEEITPEEEGHWKFTKELLRTSIQKLKNRKAPGLDNITNEWIKYRGSTLIGELHNLFNKIIEERKMPTQWKDSITIPIFKKGEKTDPQNYRGISLLGAVMKLFAKILSEVVAKTGISEEQQGFRKNRFTTDAIFVQHKVVEKAIEFNKVAFLCFVDIEKTFDNIRLADVIKILRQRKVDPNITTIIREINTNNACFIKVNGDLSKRIHVADGIRQGDSLSLILFNIIMDEIISEVMTAGKGYRMGDREIKLIAFVDDAVLIAEDEDNLQRLLYTFETTARKFNQCTRRNRSQYLRSHVTAS
ncbi:hypothetical protein M0802_003861 [Mischocyttarus mexicanus]|nr:hypothetical protein M0802_003861 [Mischocyttarus mexicanus]